MDLGIDGLADAEQIGMGGNAIVYRARQVDLDRWVAVKTLRLAHDTDSLRRFDRERKVMARISTHPGIAPIFFSGFTHGGDPYLVMPFYPDGSLADAPAMTWRQAADVMLAVAEAVEHAHQHNVLHRDLKPANIMVDPSGRPVVVDFGIAQVVSGTSSISTAITLTPSYAPPEAFEGTTTDPRSDVYSLGATLHGLIGGSPPFETDGVGVLAALGRVANDPPPDLRALAPTAICELIEQAMAKSVDDRPATAAEFAERLAAAVRVGAAPASVAGETASDAPIADGGSANAPGTVVIEPAADASEAEDVLPAEDELGRSDFERGPDTGLDPAEPTRSDSVERLGPSADADEAEVERAPATRVSGGDAGIDEADVAEVDTAEASRGGKDAAGNGDDGGGGEDGDAADSAVEDDPDRRHVALDAAHTSYWVALGLAVAALVAWFVMFPMLQSITPAERWSFPRAPEPSSRDFEDFYGSGGIQLALVLLLFSLFGVIGVLVTRRRVWWGWLAFLAAGTASVVTAVWLPWHDLHNEYDADENVFVTDSFRVVLVVLAGVVALGLLAFVVARVSWFMRGVSGLAVVAVGVVVPIVAWQSFDRLDPTAGDGLSFTSSCTSGDDDGPPISWGDDELILLHGFDPPYDADRSNDTSGFSEYELDRWQQGVALMSELRVAEANLADTGLRTIRVVRRCPVSNSLAADLLGTTEAAPEHRGTLPDPQVDALGFSSATGFRAWDFDEFAVYDGPRLVHVGSFGYEPTAEEIEAAIRDVLPAS